MTDEQLEQIGNDLVAMFGDKLPDPEHEPIRFKYYINLLFYMKRNGYE
jgi:hypothetical protein